MDVRLTMGGEPTFVSIDDRDGAEWNTTALGPTKRGCAIDLLLRLKERYGAGGFLHFGQGKWYPGEQLPRWALSVIWRSDGEACWGDPALFADECSPSDYATDDAERFMRALIKRLGIDSKYALPGYEDAWYYLWRERRLPINVDAFDSRLDDELERARLRRVFDHGLSSPSDMRCRFGRETSNVAQPFWASSSWFLRDERMYLIPGDSPMGYRLPLDSLPWSAPRIVRGWRNTIRSLRARRFRCTPIFAPSTRRMRWEVDSPKAARWHCRPVSNRRRVPTNASAERGQARASALPDRVPERFESASDIDWYDTVCRSARSAARERTGRRRQG